jgi:hypothetical protein
MEATRIRFDGGLGASELGDPAHRKDASVLFAGVRRDDGQASTPLTHSELDDVPSLEFALPSVRLVEERAATIPNDRGTVGRL